MVQLAPGNHAVRAELLTQIQRGAAVEAVETADTLYVDGAPTWLLEAALLALHANAANADDNSQTSSSSALGSWVCGWLCA